MRRQTRALRFLGLFLAMVIAGVPGCWSRKEIDSLGFITIAGLDAYGDTGRILLTVHFAKPFAIATEQAARGAQEKPFWVVNVEGETMSSAVRELFLNAPRTPFWGHCRLILVGEELARRGIKDVVDWFDRNGRVGKRPNVAVVKGGTAAELLQGEFSLERMPVQGYTGLLESASLMLSRFRTSCLVELTRILEEEGMEPVLPAFDIVRVRSGSDDAGELVRTEITTTAKLAGFAVFRGDKLVGWLDEEESRFYHLIGGLFVEADYIDVPDPHYPGKVVSLQLTRSRGEVDPVVSGDRVSFRVRVWVRARVTGVQREFDPVKTPSDWSDLERAFEKEIEAQVAQVVSKAKSLNADIFGFGASLYRNAPQLWARLKDAWDDMFPVLAVEVEVDAALLRTGVVLRSIRER